MRLCLRTATAPTTSARAPPHKRRSHPTAGSHSDWCNTIETPLCSSLSLVFRSIIRPSLCVHTQATHSLRSYVCPDAHITRSRATHMHHTIHTHPPLLANIHTHTHIHTLPFTPHAMHTAFAWFVCSLVRADRRT